MIIFLACLLTAAIICTVFAALYSFPWLILLCGFLYFIALLTFLTMMCVIYKSYDYDGHKIEVYLGAKTYILAYDGKVIDSYKAWIVTSLTLKGVADGNQLLINVETGFYRPNIILFINNIKQPDSNAKSKK